MNDKWKEEEHFEESEKNVFDYIVNRFNTGTVGNSNLSHSDNTLDGMVYKTWFAALKSLNELGGRSFQLFR